MMVSAVCLKGVVPGSLILAFAAAVVIPATSAAQTGSLNVHFARVTTAPARVPALVSVLRDGRIVRQQEVVLEQGSAIWCCIRQLESGSYDVRVEGEGLVTQAKRGFLVIDGQDVSVTFIVRPGRGMHVVEYSEGGLAREEVAVRLSALEAGLARVEGFRSKPSSEPLRVAEGSQCCTITTIDLKTGIVSAVDLEKRPFHFQVPLESMPGRTSGFEPIDRARGKIKTLEPINGVKLLQSLRVGQKVSVDADGSVVTVDGGAPCCSVVKAIVRP
jgi:hypothetical protein